MEFLRIRNYCVSQNQYKVTKDEYWALIKPSLRPHHFTLTTARSVYFLFLFVSAFCFQRNVVVSFISHVIHFIFGTSREQFKVTVPFLIFPYLYFIFFFAAIILCLCKVHCKCLHSDLQSSHPNNSLFSSYVLRVQRTFHLTRMPTDDFLWIAFVA